MFAGTAFLAMLSWGVAPSAILDPSSFKDKLEKHLRELSVVLRPSEAKSLGSWDALRALIGMDLFSHSTPRWCEPLHRDLLGQKVVLKLPHLISLRLDYLRNAELVIICLQLAEAHFQGMASMHIEIKEAALNRLVLRRCEGVNFLVNDKLQSLQSLIVWYCGDVGKRLTRAICQMTCLETLEYRGFLAARMPRSFPASLRDLWLHPKD